MPALYTKAGEHSDYSLRKEHEKEIKFVFYVLQIILFCINFDVPCVWLLLSQEWDISVFCLFLVQNHNFCVDIFLYQRI